MRTTSGWAFRRRFLYGLFFATVFIVICVFVYFRYFYVAPNCFDGLQDENEAGIDCGGGCVRICNFETVTPSVKWSRSFRVTEGMYNAVAYVDNFNRVASTEELKYTFALYDDAGLITERSGTTILPPNSVYPIFEGRIKTGDRVPTRTFLELEEVDMWQPSDAGSEQFTIVDRELRDVGDKPRLNAIVSNNDLEEAEEVEFVATIFDSARNALTSSRTYVDNFDPRSETEIVFTWPEPIATTIRSCEVPTDVLVAIDLSGSMNNDNDAPPQPLTSVIEAASSFVSRLGENDQVGLVTFATEAELTVPLTNNRKIVGEVIDLLTIAPEEEVGSTNTGAAILVAGQELVSDRQNSDARKVLVLLTDGLATAPDENPEEYALEVASKAPELGIEVYVIGLGEQVNMQFVRSIATDSTYAYQALSTENVDSIYRTITASLCEDGPAVIDIIAKTDAGFVQLR